MTPVLSINRSMWEVDNHLSGGLIEIPEINADPNFSVLFRDCYDVC